MNIPKLKFKDNNGNDYPSWTNSTIGKSGYFYYGKSAPKWSITDTATIPCVRYGELYTTHNIMVKKIYSYTNIPKENLKFSTGNEVLVPRVGEEPLDFCKCCYLPFKNVAIGEMISVYNTKNNPLFVSYMFNGTMKYKFAKFVEGGNVSNLYYSYLENIPIKLPSLKEQEKIANFLSTVDKKIENLANTITSLENQKKGLLQQIFSQKLRFKDKNGNNYPDWEKKKLGDIANSFDYGMNAPSKEFDGINKYIRITDIDEITHKFINKNIVSPNGILDNKYLVNKNDILFARTGASTGKTYIYDTNDGILYFAGFLIRANIPEKYNSYFIFLNTLTQKYKNWVKIESTRSGQPGINAEQYKSYNVFVPCLEEQTKIADFLSAFDRKLDNQKAQLEHWQQIKKGLLQQMFV
ncbi:restriction endonuclease subunit S [uncultured Megamonas sp.]|mgnify:CR=1 FL=1|uniref:restriction endonuclease subunit S n=1 Tax=uncultured Megamonas sp. TaxID=286140 RepID=UPI0025FC5D2A|nr:restriction endonuclease subunit S [uncultured Megamonas sp.]